VLIVLYRFALVFFDLIVYKSYVGNYVSGIVQTWFVSAVSVLKTTTKMRTLLEREQE
jgi:hypothetical protein